ncbi:hypothetical protein LTR62_002856 [Meristemomyces frigidus]|uniref:Histone acetyltransferase type B catalytic subunit n=1 Tax=Meristemomyces frigidus TaxID=1508187 RepID=A0AAN7TRX7_9PEZI|nr:hypothetical protein LTR62_002856 [Meristemomyces frigidus]
MDDDDELTAEITAQVDSWSTNSNTALHLSLHTPTTTLATFHPEFTYSIFGEEEAIFGYRGLKISIRFAAHDLRPRVSIEYGQKFEETLGQDGEVKATDVKAALSDFLPEAAFEEGALKWGDEKAFRPPGEKTKEYTRDGVQHEIWCSSLADADARRVLQNMQILVPLFIEGGSILQLEHDWSTQRWKLFLLYRLDGNPRPQASPYSLVGFGTSYRVSNLPGKDPSREDLDAYTFTHESLEALLPSPDATDESMLDTNHSPLDLPSRERLSQFLILPPYQGTGHGQQLYNNMYTHLISDPNVHEFTVEDPNEAFDDLRDLCDLRHLRKHVPEFSALRVTTTLTQQDLDPLKNIPTALIVSGPTRAAIQKKTKLASRQFGRLVEMHTLSFIPPSHRSRSRITRKLKCSNENDKAYYLWRLFVKERLYLHNRDLLAQVERSERVERLEGAVDGVLEGYVALLERVDGDKGLTDAAEGDDEVVEGAAQGRRQKKRRTVVNDEEDEDGDEDDVNAEKVEVAKQKGRKKVRTG